MRFGSASDTREVTIARDNTIAKSAHQLVDGLSGGMLSILREAVQSYGGTRASQSATSLAYYGMLSLFPLLLPLLAIASFFLERSGKPFSLNSQLDQCSQYIIRYATGRAYAGSRGLPFLQRSAEKLASSSAKGQAVSEEVGSLWLGPQVTCVLNCPCPWSGRSSQEAGLH
jgi:uncharacterized BrkB/YihY/UPF0761 family membrane protein